MKDTLSNKNPEQHADESGSSAPSCSTAWCEVDEIIEVLEKHGLGWSLDHTGRLIEARIWDWPNVVGRYRPNKVEPLVHMLQTAMLEVPKHYWENVQDKPQTKCR